MNAILNYHRICPDNVFKKPNDELVVSESKFRKQLIFLKKNYNIISLDSLLRFENKNEFNVSITFDDGYKDNLTYALPILNELKIPATIYIITKFYEKEGSIWWWELQDYIWENSQNIQFTYSDKKYDFSIKSNSQKKECFIKLKSIIKKLNNNEQKKLLTEITKTSLRKQFTNEFLTKQDLKILNSNPLITIGAHTHNHLSLKNLRKEECIQEIKKSKEILENLLNCEISHFSYPYGTKNDASEREFQLAEELGFKSAVTTSVEVLSKRNLFNLPRIHINEKVNERILKFKLSIYYIFYKKIQLILNLAKVFN